MTLPIKDIILIEKIEKIFEAIEYIKQEMRVPIKFIKEHFGEEVMDYLCHHSNQTSLIKGYVIYSYCSPKLKKSLLKKEKECSP